MGRMKQKKARLKEKVEIGKLGGTGEGTGELRYGVMVTMCRLAKRKKQFESSEELFRKTLSFACLP